MSQQDCESNGCCWSPLNVCDQPSLPSFLPSSPLSFPLSLSSLLLSFPPSTGFLPFLLSLPPFFTHPLTHPVPTFLPQHDPWCFHKTELSNYIVSNVQQTTLGFQVLHCASKCASELQVQKLLLSHFFCCLCMCSWHWRSIQVAQVSELWLLPDCSEVRGIGEVCVEEAWVLTSFLSLSLSLHRYCLWT